MSEELQPDDSVTRLRDTAAEFSRMRGALQQAGELAVVNASPLARYRLDVLDKRATTIQGAIESVGKMVDGARHWFSDTFGTDVETEVPIANPVIESTIQTSIAGMNYFLKDAREELNRVLSRQKQYDALPPEKKDSVLSELRAEDSPVPVVKAGGFAVPKKWLWIGAGALAVAVWYFNDED